MKYIFTVIMLILYASLSFGQDSIFFRVQDSKTDISFCEFYIGEHIFLLTDETGCLTVPKKMLTIGDTIKIQSLGYASKNYIVNSAFLENSSVCVELKTTEYNIGEVQITSDGFDAYKFFKKKKKWSKVYSKSHTIHAEAKYGYSKEGEYMHNTGAFDIKYPITRKSFMGDSTIFRYIKQAIGISISIPIVYSANKYQKKFKYKYCGKINTYDVFDIDMTNMPDRFKNGNKKDEIKSLIYLDKNGIVIKDETKYVVHKDYKTLSYIVSNKYGLNSKNEIYPIHTIVTFFIPNWSREVDAINRLKLDYGSEVHIDLRCSHE